MIKTLRDALNAIDLHETPIVAGVGAPSTRETIQLARDAAASGAEFVLVVPPGYYARVLKANPAAMHKFFIDVAAASPVPVLVVPKYRAHGRRPWRRGPKCKQSNLLIGDFQESYTTTRRLLLG